MAMAVSQCGFFSSRLPSQRPPVPGISLAGSKSRIGASAWRSEFMDGELGKMRRQFSVFPLKKKGRTGVARAKKDSDVPAFKGFPPMQSKPGWHWRILCCIPYIMPLCESWMYAETAYNIHCFIEQFEFWTMPVLNLLGRLPSWFLLAYFFVAYLGIVRKNIWPHFFRFHVVMGMLLEILLQVLGTVNDWIPQSLYWGKIGAHFWLFVFFTYLGTTMLSIRCALSGMYADIPFLSDAAYLQIPYDT